MMKLLRRHKDWLMIVIAILAIPFIFYFVQRPDYGAMRSDQFARMYDRNVSMLEAQQIARLLSLAQALGMSDFVGTLTAGAGTNQNQVAIEFIVNLLVLRHEADRLGLRPGTDDGCQQNANAVSAYSFATRTRSLIDTHSLSV